MATNKLYCCKNPACVENGERLVFVARQPICPKCKTSADDPKFGQLIIRVVAIHYDPPTHIPGIHEGTRACNPEIPIAGSADLIPGMEMPNPFHGGTGEPSVVSCPECKATEVWQKAMQERLDEEDNRESRAFLRRLLASAKRG